MKVIRIKQLAPLLLAVFGIGPVMGQGPAPNPPFEEDGARDVAVTVGIRLGAGHLTRRACDVLCVRRSCRLGLGRVHHLAAWKRGPGE